MVVPASWPGVVAEAECAAAVFGRIVAELMFVKMADLCLLGDPNASNRAPVYVQEVDFCAS